MRFAVICWLCICTAGCKEKAATPTKTSAPVPAEKRPGDDDLQRFLNGLLVTSDIKPSHEAIWPNSPESETTFYWHKGRLSKLYGVDTPEKLRDTLKGQPVVLSRNDLWIRGTLGDWVTGIPSWRHILEEDPSDCEAATRIAQDMFASDGAKATLDALAHADPADRPRAGRVGGCSKARFLSLKAGLFLMNNQLPDAKEAAAAAEALDETYGARMLASVLLAMGKKKEALTQAERVSALAGHENAQTFLTLGLAQRENGQAELAQQTWRAGLARFPEGMFLAEALAGENRSVAEWEMRIRRDDVHYDAKDIALAGVGYAEVGLTDLSETCYRAAEAMEPGVGFAWKTVWTNLKSPEEAVTKLVAVTKPNSSVELMTALAWAQLKTNRVADAAGWVDKALAIAPRDAKAMSLKWQVCGEQKDLLCVINYRRLLGLPSHYNVEEYRDAAKALREQALKNGEGLAAKEAPSADTAKPPHVDAIIIVPLGDRVSPELADIGTRLSGWLPGVKVSVAGREDVPSGSYNVERGQLVYEKLSNRLREEPGTIFVVEDDLAGADSKFSFARYDIVHARAVVSLSRLRDAGGRPTPAGTTLDAPLLAESQRRLESLLLGVVGTVMGLSHSCDEKSCVMRERRAVTDFEIPQSPFCAKHAKELADAIAQPGKH